MKQILPSIALACCFVALSPPARPQTATDASRSCRQLQDPGERLRCYDAQDAAVSSAPGSPPPVAARPAAPSTPPGTLSPGTPPAAPAAVPSPTVAPPAAKFGAEDLPSTLRPPAPPSDNALVASITSVQQVRPKVFNITLANGQVWRQEGTQATIFFRAGADARIEKGTLGGYRMSTSTTGSKLWVRVTRIR